MPSKEPHHLKSHLPKAGYLKTPKTKKNKTFLIKKIDNPLTTLSPLTPSPHTTTQHNNNVTTIQTH